MHKISEKIQKWDKIQQLYKLSQKRPYVVVDGVWPCAHAFLACLIAENSHQSSIIVTANIKIAERLYNEISVISPEETFLFPAWEVLPQDTIPPSEDIVAERYHLIRKVMARPDQKKIVIIPLASLIYKIFSRSWFEDHCITLEVGHEPDRQKLITDLVGLGYERVALVQFRGEMAVRGCVMDIYNIVDEYPVRVEVDGNKIISLKYFDSSHQRSFQEINKISIFPRQEKEQYKHCSDWVNVVDYFEDYQLILVEKASIVKQAKLLNEQLTRTPSNFIGLKGFQKIINSTRVIELNLLAGEIPKESGYIKLPISPYESPGRSGDSLVGFLKTQKEQSFTHAFCFHNHGEARRLKEYFREKNIHIDIKDELTCFGPFQKGFYIDDIKYGFVTDDEVFGRYRQRRFKPRYRHGSPLMSVFDIKKGDYVVHVDHGVGIYQCIEKVMSDEITRDYLVILYDENTKLLVPVEQINLIEKYVGLERARPKLNKIGQEQWKKTKLKAAKAIRDVAADLLRLQARRELERGTSMAKEQTWQEEFEDAFIYEETRDQAQAINDVKQDMENTKPMDRLICGDVGYGKTEVAMRAAFKAVMNNKQVVFLVPTTILAEQHYNSFKERMAEYPIEIACWTRFTSGVEEKAILKSLKEGRIDIVIGTHKLIFGDLGFKDLGLLVIDEEQRFGVMHKERIKQMRVSVDVLTLSATPIPRTLYLTLTGAKDMSVINTPPEDRLPIETCISQFDEKMIRDAILRELNRDGQIYFVHNRVYNIDVIAKRIQNLVPQARIAVGHGQMTGHTLEHVMKKFVNRDIDILVSTTIIQSGLDIPNVNTIFINNADKFGLADLYQLRGRVGRFKHRGYCYLLVSVDHVVPEEAAKRLRIIEEFTELGSGMKIAARDLEIRGAGNILGVQQSGYIAQIGFDLYCRLLDRTIKEMKGEAVPADDVVLDLGIDIGVPEEYISNPEMRLDIFRKLSNVYTQDDLCNFQAMIRDRYGPLPDTCKILMDTAMLRIEARKKSISYLGVERGMLVYVQKNTRKRIKESFANLTDRDRVKSVMACIQNSIQNPS
ncbi:transcription-repair coupling factor [PVC group bacterium]|nr:transcription-repair coupling factor [PVC group bacterium]